VSIRTGAKGPNSATSTACTTSAHSIGDSYKIIERNDADVMICGGAEASITPMGIGGFASMRALSQRNDDPEHASRPWEKYRDGFIVGEGSGILVLEEYEHAKARGAKILAEIVGYGMSGDAYHITAPDVTGNGAIRVMKNAIADAGLTANDIDYVNAHGTSTPAGDRAEASAVKTTFEGNDHLVVSSTKSMTGHLLGAAGGLEAGITILALRDQIAPPTMNYFEPDPEITGIDFVPNKPRPMEINYALSNSFGFGGTNGSLIFKRFTE
jgi:3-oxoacyl-[acyl-carrier-protein] synthase II